MVEILLLDRDHPRDGDCPTMTHGLKVCGGGGGCVKPILVISLVKADQQLKCFTIFYHLVLKAQ